MPTLFVIMMLLPMLWAAVFIIIARKALLPKRGARFLIVIGWVLAGAFARSVDFVGGAGVPGFMDILIFPAAPFYMSQEFHMIAYAQGGNELARSWASWGAVAGICLAIQCASIHYFLWVTVKAKSAASTALRENAMVKAYSNNSGHEDEVGLGEQM